MDESNRYYVKDAGDVVPAGLPCFAVYENTAVGARLVCLCIDDATARHIASLLQATDDHAGDDSAEFQKSMDLGQLQL